MEMLQPLKPPGKGKEGKVFAQAKVSGFHDKGTGALVEFETKVTDEDGNEILKMVNGEFYRGIKELGDIGPFQGAGQTFSHAVPPPARAPDMAIELPIPHNAAHIYRLSGDYLPHHIDPAAAKRVGYDRVILHGLCTLGYVTGTLLTSLCNNDVNRFKRVKMRFSAPVHLGELLVVEAWHDGPGRVIFQARARDRDEVVVKHAYFEYHEQSKL